MAVNAKAESYREKMRNNQEGPFAKSDPEFFELFANFAMDEVVSQNDLDDRTAMISTLAVLLGCGGIDEFRIMVSAALNFGVDPVEIKETIYQAAAYLGIGRVFPFLKACNEVFAENGIIVSDEPRTTTTLENRREKGSEVQAKIFGDYMKDFWKSGPEETRHINTWLAANCFGDYYTRKGLDLKMRELITFCFLYAQGGCEPQLASHATGNLRLGTDRATLIKVISRNIPYIGYPRTLNALRIINKAADEFKE